MRFSELLIESFGFEDSRTDMATYDEMMSNPEYYARAKRRKGSVVMMTPLEYILRSTKGFKKTGEVPELTPQMLRQSRDPERIKRYAQQMLHGEKFPTPILDYSIGFSQEGLHRAMAFDIATKTLKNARDSGQLDMSKLEELGPVDLDHPKMPVFVVSMTPNKERQGRKASY